MGRPRRKPHADLMLKSNTSHGLLLGTDCKAVASDACVGSMNVHFTGGAYELCIGHEYSRGDGTQKHVERWSKESGACLSDLDSHRSSRKRWLRHLTDMLSGMLDFRRHTPQSYPRHRTLILPKCCDAKEAYAWERLPTSQPLLPDVVDHGRELRAISVRDSVLGGRDIRVPSIRHIIPSISISPLILQGSQSLLLLSRRRGGSSCPGIFPPSIQNHVWVCLPSSS